MATLLLSSFILGTVYKSNLMAMLSTPKMVRPFDSLAELVATDIPFKVAAGSVISSIFKVCSQRDIFKFETLLRIEIKQSVKKS